MEPPRSIHKLALVGLMGSGKTRVGRLTALALGWPFADLDEQIVLQAQATIPILFETEGEAGFRDREARLLGRFSEDPPPLVLATGGGAVLDPGNRRLLAGAFYVVWLKVTPEEAARRVGTSRARPLLRGQDPHAVLDRLARTRDDLYAEIADLVLVTTSETQPEDLRDEILDALEGTPPVDGL